MFLCAITGGHDPAATLSQRLDHLVDQARSWARGGVQLIQIREKDLTPADLLELSTAAVAAVREHSSATRVLVNGPAALAHAAGADGVHLRSHASHDAIQAARHTFHPQAPIISVACHTSADVVRIRNFAADFIVFAPVFGKRLPGGESLPGAGLALLAEACTAAGHVPVLALGGVTADNASGCIAAGAAGIAAIRLFQQDDWRLLAAPARDLASHPSPA
jgi:thiamine-phosphate pyrophosphorylase